MSGFTDTIESTDQQTRVVPPGAGDHDKMSHYVDKNDKMRALVEGIPCTALCGKTWLPSRDGDLFPLCARCKEVHASLPRR